MTSEQAEQLLGTTGIVVSPVAGRRDPFGTPDGRWKCIGYTIKPDDPDVVASLSLESVAQTERMPIYGDRRDYANGGALPITGYIDPHPVELRPVCDPRWFRPDIAEKTGKPAVAAASASSAG